LLTSLVLMFTLHSHRSFVQGLPCCNQEAGSAKHSAGIQIITQRNKQKQAVDL